MRCSLSLKGDNITALTMALQLRAPPGPVKAIARELALDYADASFEPSAATHVPGVANSIADLLSRRFDPDAPPWRVPTFLQSATEVHLPARSPSYYRL